VNGKRGRSELESCSLELKQAAIASSELALAQNLLSWSLLAILAQVEWNQACKA